MVALPAAAEPTRSVSFETDPVRPLALSADGTRLYVANTAAGSLDMIAVIKDACVAPENAFLPVAIS